MFTELDFQIAMLYGYFLLSFICIFVYAGLLVLLYKKVSERSLDLKEWLVDLFVQVMLRYIDEIEKRF